MASLELLMTRVGIPVEKPARLEAAAAPPLPLTKPTTQPPVRTPELVPAGHV